MLASNNQHGIHSPFVFDLVTKCFYDRRKYPEYKLLKKYRQQLLDNTDFIEVTDFGSGSKVFKSNRRQVSRIAKTAGITEKRAELLFRIVRYFEPTKILEVGTSLGLGTSALSLGNASAQVTTLEGCPETAAVAKFQAEKSALENIKFEIGEFNQLLSFGLQHSTFDLIYFDGNHQKAATLDYFEKLLPSATNNSVWIFDDIHWSTEMEEAWKTIKNHPKVTVTIDTFQWGLVFFRKEQEKEHFTIRS
ncbi:O-methyltransferase [Flavobacterium silvaticum]|uniref:Class I SAM-dependent methyltransferase n=1 Tax=Flavobacterium silvaticum TaxID=1852020 RepID=A0A972JKM7_9FLAO|nr:class I SAM-dependent methyltransferase [Flavobacterium silvaticum]NMH29292.1 class I SAM-dependent methyltransferase [Flavobacterium silvaticum]